jgi:hypothetical protein
MNLTALLTRTRAFLDDEVVPYLWSDAFLIGALNNAQNEACIRREIITDSTTVATCQITLAAGTATYALDPRVLAVKKNAKLATSAYPIPKLSIAQMDLWCSGWRDYPAGLPSAFYLIDGGKKIGLHPVPDAVTTLLFGVWRMPLLEMVAGGDSPEIPAYFHAALVHFACYEAFLSPSSEKANMDKSAMHLNQFAAVFGPARSAVDFVRMADQGEDQRVHPVAFGGMR